MKKRLLEGHNTKRYRCSDDDDQQHDVSTTVPTQVPADGNYTQDDPYLLYNSAHLLYREQGGSDIDFFNFFYQQQQTAADTQTQIHKLTNSNWLL